MDGNEDLLRQLHGIVNSVSTATVVQQVVKAYDDVAVVALRAVLQRDVPDEAPYEAPDVRVRRQAAEAWAIADAMMAERAKRGLGRLPEAAT